jgi:colanic acid biosynthesis glycosyl transferase WcaI
MSIAQYGRLIESRKALKSPMRILFLTQLFEPEPTMKGIGFVRGLQSAGHHVEVVTGFPNYPGGKIYPAYRGRRFLREVIDGVAITRLPLRPSHNNSSAGRAWHFLSFFLSALLYGLKNGRRFDLVYVGHPGITTGLAALLFGGLWRRPYILDIQDLWPDSLVASGLDRASTMAKMFGPICNLVHNRAAHIVAQSEGIAKMLIARGASAQRVSVIYNWAPDAPAVVPQNHDRCDGKFAIVYAGNMGPLQALGSVIRAAKLAAEKVPSMTLTLIGDGVELAMLKALAMEVNAHNIEFKPRVAVSQIGDILAEADALLIHLSDQALLEITIPSKTQSSLAMGKPILAGVKGEVAAILQDSAAAVVTPPEDVMALANAMVQLATLSPEMLAGMGRAGRTYYDQKLGLDSAIAKTLAICDKVFRG